MPKSQQTPAARRYLRRIATTSLLYLVATFLAYHVFWHAHIAFWPAVGLALIPSIPIVAIIVFVGIYLKEETDEFQRVLYMQSLLCGTGGTLAVLSFWGFLHLFAHVPGVDAFHIFAFFWLLTGLSNWPLRRYYGGSGE
jgi:hypothetical protein